MGKFGQLAILVIAALALLLSACGDRSNETPAGPGGQMPEAPDQGGALPTEASAIPAEVTALADALAAAGLTASTGENESVGLFDMTPSVMTVNGQRVEVYRFQNAQDAGNAASTIPALLAVTRWTAAPHFYQRDNLIVLYLGEDAAITAALENQLGAAISSATSDPDGDAENVSQINIYLIALEDNGATGDAVGCGDSIIPVVRDIPPTASPIEAALTDLFSIKDQYYGESGLYNALYQSDLAVESATLEDGLATVYLTGQFMLGGVCDNPRFQAQLEYTVLQFAGVEAVQIYINNQPLNDLLTGEG